MQHRVVRIEPSTGVRTLLLLVTALAAAAAADDTKTVADAAGKIALDVPASWEIKLRKDEKASLAAEAKVPGAEFPVDLAVYVLHGPMDALAQAYYERDRRAREPNTISVAVAPGPPPVLIWNDRGNQREWTNAISYAVVRRNGVHLSLVCSIHDWPRIEAAFPAIAKSVRADVAEWPALPATFERTEWNGYTWFVHPDVKARDVHGLRKLVKRVERRYEKVHGRVVKADGSPPFLVVCNHLAEARKVDDKVGHSEYGSWFDNLAVALYLTPLPSDPGPNHAYAAGRLTQLLHVVHYGGRDPLWMYVGDYRLAWSEERTGARPPKLGSGLVEDLPPIPQPLREVWEHGLRDEPPSGFRDQAAAWALFLRAGPAKYRRACAAFRKDLLATRDVTGAMELHLLSLDAHAMRKDAADWLGRAVTIAKKKKK